MSHSQIGFTDMTIPKFKGLSVNISDNVACITIERDFDEGEKRATYGHTALLAVLPRKM